MYALASGTTCAAVAGELGRIPSIASVKAKPTSPRPMATTPTNEMVWPATAPADPSPPAPVYWATRMAPAAVKPPATEIVRKTRGKARLSAPTASAERRPSQSVSTTL